jgi:hypothetical protein
LRAATTPKRKIKGGKERKSGSRYNGKQPHTSPIENGKVVESAEAPEYSKKLSRATLRGSSANALRGFSSGGTAPYGYERIAISKDTGEKLRTLRQGEWMRSNLEKVVWDLGDPLEVENVKRIFQLKASGYGYVAIADQLNREGSLPAARTLEKQRPEMVSGNHTCHNR